MTKQKKITPKRSEKNNEGFLNRFSFSSIIPEKYHTFAAIVAILLLFIIFFLKLFLLLRKPHLMLNHTLPSIQKAFRSAQIDHQQQQFRQE